MSLDRKAKPNDNEKLTIKLTNPIIPIPKMDQKIVHSSITKLVPYNPKAKFPLAKVMCRISKFKPRKIPIEAVLPKKTPNHPLETIPGHLFSKNEAILLAFSLSFLEVLAAIVFVLSD